MEIDGEIVNCLVADDHWIARKGIIFAIKKNFANFTFDEACSVNEILVKLEEKKDFYKLLILDYDFSDNDIVSQILNIKKFAISSKIIIVTSSLNYFKFFEIKDYVQSIISKQCDERKLIESIKFVLNGYESYFSGLNQDVLQKVNLLTERELEIAILFSKGLLNKEIAWKLSIKETTVSTYRKRIFEKLRVTNNIEMASFFWNSIL
jgi:DNA-binding NarL/FixJ family response regulator